MTKIFEANGQSFRTTGEPTVANSAILRSQERNKQRKVALIEACDAMEDAVREALNYIPLGSAVPEWLVRLDHAAKHSRSVL